MATPNTFNIPSQSRSGTLVTPALAWSVGHGAVLLTLSMSVAASKDTTLTVGLLVENSYDGGTTWKHAASATWVGNSLGSLPAIGQTIGQNAPLPTHSRLTATFSKTVTCGGTLTVS